MKLRLTRRARQDIKEIGRYVRVRSPSGALAVRGGIQSALQVLAQHPYAGRSLGVGLHRFAVPRLPYLIFYRVDDAGALASVVTIRHAAWEQEAL